MTDLNTVKETQPAGQSEGSHRAIEVSIDFQRVIVLLSKVKSFVQLQSHISKFVAQTCDCFHIVSEQTQFSVDGNE